jgi:hypothetical protein
MRACADALDCVPMALAQNSGLSPIETLASIKSRQVKEKNTRLGVDCMQTGSSGEFVLSIISQQPHTSPLTTLLFAPPLYPLAVQHPSREALGGQFLQGVCSLSRFRDAVRTEHPPIPHRPHERPPPPRYARIEGPTCWFTWKAPAILIFGSANVHH